MPSSLELPWNFAFISSIYHTLTCLLVLGMRLLSLLLDCYFFKGTYYIL